tara:strand:+ start:1990 stop:2418 length:429 start_codon:yes stop_codon:yes gene_type:complete
MGLFDNLGSSTPTLAVIVVMIGVVLVGASTWRNAKGEGWDLVVYMVCLLLGFNLSIEFVVLFVQGLGSTFTGLGDLIESASLTSEGFGLTAIIVVLIFTVWVMKTYDGKMVRIAAQGTLYGVLVRLFLDFMFFLLETGALGN